MAKLVGVSFVSINRWERGHTSPSQSIVDLYREIETALGQGYDATALLAGVHDRISLTERLKSFPNPVSGGRPMAQMKYRCLNDNCPSYATPMAADSPLAKDLCTKLGFPSIADILSCPEKSCQDLWIEVPDPMAPVVVQQPYGALLLACDLSGSMRTPLPGRKNKNRHDLVVDAVAQLFQEFANTNVFRPPHFDHLLITVVRYGATASTYELSGSPWFTIQQLADQHRWGVEPSSGLYSLTDIDRTLREHILPAPPNQKQDRTSALPAVDGSATNFEAAFEMVAELANIISAGLNGDRSELLPANFGGIGRIPSAPGGPVNMRQWWLVTYSDGEPNAAYHGDPFDAARTKGVELARDFPLMHRVTAFLGEDTTAEHLMHELASPCVRPDHAGMRAYFGPQHAMRLRSILHLATVTQSGLCPRCLP